MSFGSCTAVLKTASRANPAVHLPYRPRARATPHRPSRNVRRYDWSASSGSVVANDPVNGRDPTGLETGTFSNGCMGDSCMNIDPGGKVHEGALKVLGTVATVASVFVPVEGIAIKGLGALGRALGIGERVTVGVAEAALPRGVTRQIFAEAGVWRTEGGVAAAATRSRAVSSEAIQGLKDAGVSKSAVGTWQKFYQGAIETVRSDGTKVINETAKYRAEVLKNVLKNW
jgi:hypothetical protein